MKITDLLELRELVASIETCDCYHYDFNKAKFDKKKRTKCDYCKIRKILNIKEIK